MTVKELIAILSTLPSDATIVYTADGDAAVYAFDRYAVDEVTYDDYDNTVTFAGTDEFSTDIPDDVDESHYNPYTGCDEYECTPFDEGW